jgi:hypothetical protein
MKKKSILFVIGILVCLLAACGKMAFFENNPEIPVYFKLRMIHNRI